MFRKLFQKSRRGKYISLTHSMRVPYPDTKDKDFTRTENYIPLSLINIQESSTKYIIANQIQQNIKRTIGHGFIYLSNARMVQHTKSINWKELIIMLIERKGENSMIISTDRKAFHKFQNLFIIKTLNNLKIERSFHNIIKTIYEKLN